MSERVHFYDLDNFTPTQRRYWAKRTSANYHCYIAWLTDDALARARAIFGD